MSAPRGIAWPRGERYQPGPDALFAPKALEVHLVRAQIHRSVGDCTDQAEVLGQLETVSLRLQKVASQYDVKDAILFGSRARQSHHVNSDADVAVILRGEGGEFVPTKLAMAGVLSTWHKRLG
jgi:predicted nucleotidyltransferase